MRKVLMSNAVVHAGAVVHSFDHYVMDIHGPDGSSAYLSLYSCGYLPGVGAGHVALARVESAAVSLESCFAEVDALGLGMQRRLAGISTGREVVSTDAPVAAATFRRAPTTEDAAFTWFIESPQHVIEATWKRGEPPIGVSAPRGSFHPNLDYVATMISYWHIELTVDGTRISGEPYAHDWFSEKLDRAFSSCHVALAETAIQGT